MIDLYVAFINSDRCPDMVAALAVLAPVIAVLMALVAALTVVAQ